MYRPDLKFVSNEVDFSFSVFKPKFDCSWRNETYSLLEGFDFKLMTYRLNNSLFEDFNIGWR